MQAKIPAQKRLRRAIHQKRQEWIDACREATKADSWEDLLQDPMSNSDDPDMWKVIKVWTALLMPTLRAKQCPKTVKLTPTSSSKPMFSYINKPGSANSTCHQPIETSTNNSRKVSMHHLLTMKAVLQFKWGSYYLPSKRSWSWQHSTLIS